MSIELVDKWASILISAVWCWVSIRTTTSLRTVTRRAVAHTLRTVWLIKVLATIVAAGTVFGVARDFGLQWSPSAVLAGLLVLFALTDKVEAIVPEKPVQTPSAYAEAWEEYSRLRKNTIRPVILLVMIGFVGIVLTAALRTRLTHQALTVLFWIVVFIALVSVLIFAYNEWKLEYWACPRCGYRFRGFWVASIMPKQCNRCGLARWSDSPQ